MSPTVYQPARNPRRNHNRLRVVIGVALLGIVGVAASGVLEARPLKARVVYGDAKPLGNGTARVFVTLDDNKKPASIGVAIAEAAMTGLPMTPVPPSPAAASLSLDLPKEAKNTGYDHVMVDWNSNGHEPDHVYTHPHFDFHFYRISEKEQMSIMPASANELHGHMFTTTFLWGSYDGKFIFIEPMITKAFIETAKTAASNELVMPLTAPAKYQTPGFYPASYAVRYDAGAKEYRISLDGLKEQK